MIEWNWKFWYYDESSFSSLEGEGKDSPFFPVLLVQKKDEKPIKLNADWFMWRRDKGKWAECGADGFADHAQIFGHLIGCWRKTLWVLDEEFQRIWSLAREEIENG